ncbi:hypothetical protein [Halalkalicoccus ordinarius]|uniref:hypothetical protein n=1 Tax=Halalkalicoccus ordinarius TaxID=3116651 RepID=UPI00300F493B
MGGRRDGRTRGDLPGDRREAVRGNRLIENELFGGGERVDLDAIEVPVVLVVGAEDGFVPPGAYEPFLDRVPSEDAATIEFPTTHVGLSVAPEVHQEGWPAVCDWLEARS